nr:helix-turn-helix domain-containing protein [Desulfobacterales bacterium]
GAIDGFSEAALAVLGRYDWPGNIRELRNLMERLVVLKQDGIIDLEDLPTKMQKHRPRVSGDSGMALSDDGICLNSAVTEFEKALILQSLEKTRWVKKRAAQLLHLNRTTLVEKIKRHQIEPSYPPDKVQAVDCG